MRPWARCVGSRSPTDASSRRARRPAREGADVSIERALLVFAAAAALLSATAPLAAQSAPQRPAPRAANGKPDLSGIWVATGAILLFEGEDAFAAARAADAAAGR